MSNSLTIPEYYLEGRDKKIQTALKMRSLGYKNCKIYHPTICKHCDEDAEELFGREYVGLCKECNRTEVIYCSHCKKLIKDGSSDDEHGWHEAWWHQMIKTPKNEDHPCYCYRNKEYFLKVYPEFI